MIMLDYGDLLYKRGVLAERTPAAIKSPTEPMDRNPATAAAPAN